MISEAGVREKNGVFTEKPLDIVVVIFIAVIVSLANLELSYLLFSNQNS